MKPIRSAGGAALLGLALIGCAAQGAWGQNAPATHIAPAKKTKPVETRVKPKPKPPLAQPVAAVPPPVVLPNPPTPVVQVQQLGIAPCVGVVDKMARQTLTSNYKVQSGWSRTNPGEHVFQSVAILNDPQNTPPDGLAALVATPTVNGSCDGVTVQVFPLAGDCDAAQKLIQASGSVVKPILNGRILFDRNGRRLFLVPGFAKTCIAIAIDSTFGNLAK